MEEIKSDIRIPSGKPRVDSMNDLVTFLLSVETDLTQDDYPRLFPPRPILRGDVTCTVSLGDLYICQRHTRF